MSFIHFLKEMDKQDPFRLHGKVEIRYSFEEHGQKAVFMAALNQFLRETTVVKIHGVTSEYDV